MHAVVVQVQVNDRDAATSNLRENVVPGVSQAPGFVAGYWVGLGPEKGGRAVIVFESEEQAQAMAERIPQETGDDNFVTFESIDVGEVVANA
ncbi:MAG: hypothetical protein QOE65_591 [Solirubrobacteraceae bacterium]|jgi:hypothetical protein|nr:hypothetical protein [Solirubrobacteraceae bacterium]